MVGVKRVLFILAVMLACDIAGVAQPVRQHLNFDRGWRFHFGHAADARRDFNFSIANIYSKTGKAETTAIDPKFDDAAWRELSLPHDWAVELPFVESENFDVMAHGYKPVGGLFPETSVGWYRKRFTVAPSDSGKRFALQFDGVFRDSRVWVNGFFVGRNESGYIGATYDITDVVNFQDENVIVVRVDASQFEGWFYEGAGIYRHVWLNVFDNVHVPDGGTFVYTQVGDNAAQVFSETEVRNAGFETVDVELMVHITDRTAKRTTNSRSVKLRLQPGETKVVKSELEMSTPTLWSVQNPYLYRLHTTLKAQDRITDYTSTRFGVRSIGIGTNNELLLNGAPIKIKGVNCHQDHAGVGSALPDYLQYYRIRLLKEMGVNAYRASHNPPTPELLDACDSLGMLVMDETRLLNSSEEYLDQLRRLVRRDRNHPSVYMWSIGNEEGWVQKNSVGKRVALTMLAALRNLDSTRTATYAADLGNEFNGINEVIPVRGFNYREKFIIPYHKDHPRHPIVGTEMGSTVTTRGIYEVDSVRGYLTDQDINAPWWASTAEAWWPIAAENPWVMGGFIWTGFDYRGEPTPFKWPNISSHFGVMDVCGFPKNIYYYYQSWWTDKDVLHISPHWNWPGMEGKPVDVWVNSNADEVELFLNGKTLGKKSMPRNGHLKWQPIYQQGVLMAVGYRDGRRITSRQETTGTPASITLVADRKRLDADGMDASVINVDVRDAKGRIVPNASNLISFNITGPGKIIGVGNGDPSSHERDSYNGSNATRSLFNGKCQVIIQSSREGGTIRIEAKADNLKAASVSIDSNPAPNTSSKTN